MAAKLPGICHAIEILVVLRDFKVNFQSWSYTIWIWLGMVMCSEKNVKIGSLRNIKPRQSKCQVGCGTPNLEWMFGNMHITCIIKTKTDYIEAFFNVTIGKKVAEDLQQRNNKNYI
jgi:hypothetical protein